MKSEIIEDQIETQTFKDLLLGQFESYDAGERQLFKQAMVAIVLVNLMYEFDGVSGSKSFGLPLLNDSCETVVEKQHSEKPDSSVPYSLKGDSTREENINTEILILLSLFFCRDFLHINGKRIHI